MLIEPTPMAADQALVAEPGQGPEPGAEALREVPALGVVEVGDVDVVEAEPRQRLLQRGADARLGEVPLAAQVGADREALVVQRAGRVVLRDQAASDLGRHAELVAGAAGEEGAEPPLGEAEAVVGRGVEQAHAGGPRGLEQRTGGGLVEGDPVVADPGSPQAEPGRVGLSHGRTGSRSIDPWCISAPEPAAVGAP